MPSSGWYFVMCPSARARPIEDLFPQLRFGSTREVVLDGDCIVLHVPNDDGGSARMIAHLSLAEHVASEAWESCERGGRDPETDPIATFDARYEIKWRLAESDVTFGAALSLATQLRRLVNGVVFSGLDLTFFDGGSVDERPTPLHEVKSDGILSWIVGEDFKLWTKERTVAFAYGSRLELQGGFVVEFREIERVTSFLDEAALGHRGVKITLRSGEERVVVEEHDAAAELDPTYGMANVMIDAAWLSELGRDLGATLGVRHVDELP